MTHFVAQQDLTHHFRYTLDYPHPDNERFLRDTLLARDSAELKAVS